MKDGFMGFRFCSRIGFFADLGDIKMARMTLSCDVKHGSELVAERK